MRPRPCANMRRPTAWATTKQAVRFTAIVAFQSASDRSSAGARRTIPALFTSTSIAPVSDSASATARSTAVASVTSATMPRCGPPGSRDATSRTLSARSTRARCAPRPENTSATARPIPAAPPVTNTTLPVKSKAFSKNMASIGVPLHQESGAAARRIKEWHGRSPHQERHGRSPHQGGGGVAPFS